MPPFLLTIYFVLSALCVFSAATACHDPLFRKEWRALSRKEKEHFIQAVKCLADIPSEGVFHPTVHPNDIAPYNTSGSIYDDFVYAHMDLNHHIHFTGLFYPWHRWMLSAFELKLRSHCHYEGALPYWDWTKDAHHFAESPFFKDDDPKSGLGGFGDATKELRIMGGAFSDSSPSPFTVSYPFPHTLRRNLTLIAPTGELFTMPGFVWNKTRSVNESFTEPVVQSLIDGFVGDPKGFQAKMEGAEGPHANVHSAVGGDLAGYCPVEAPPGCLPGPTFSPNDPLFFLHHAMVDRVWSKWQNRHPLNKNAFYGGSVQAFDSVANYSLYPTGAPPMMSSLWEIPTNGLAAPLVIQDVMSTTKGRLCYVYDHID
ncbi:Di-copper centre-containing protein [Mycena amicta]|nr:Di-copper centre-containing protein [Mycena amicta]